jgi:hypothetical protein
MTAGRVRWVERMRQARAMGLIDRFPGGRKRGSGKEPKSVQQQAKEVVVQGGRELADDGGGELAQRLRELTDLAIEKLDEVTSVDPATVTRERLQLLRLQKNAAATVLNAQIRVDEETLRAAERRTERLGLIVAALLAVPDTPAPIEIRNL